MSRVKLSTRIPSNWSQKFVVTVAVLASGASTACQSQSAVHEPKSSGANSPHKAQTDNEGGSESASASAESPLEAPSPPDASVLLDEREPDPSRALPRLSYSHLGMHIGGDSNSAEAKRPWFAGIEAGESKLLRCYRHVYEPESGGSFGVDLYVGRKGGAPEVRGSRQKIGGAEFESCMKEAFEALNFQKPARPTVLSYSLLFELEAYD